MMKTSWPHGHKFAFTIFDDTDWATVDNVKPVYDLLADFGMRITKSVWVFNGDRASRNGGLTCEDRQYLKWVLSLQQQGFEIGLHNVAPVTSCRERTRRGLDRFRELFGKQRIIHCNHLDCQENLYWGEARVSSWRRTLYNVATKGRRRNVFRGHLEGDPLFWGDLCQERVSYVRNFVFDHLNTLALCSEMPYHDPGRTFVNYWFCSANGTDLRHFLKNFTFRHLDRLAEEGGLCIAYAHCAAGFAAGSKLNPEFRQRLEYIASKNGWFAPVSEILDYLRGNGNRESRTISSTQLRRLECQWLVSKVFQGTS